MKIESVYVGTLDELKQYFVNHQPLTDNPDITIAKQLDFIKEKSMLGLGVVFYKTESLLPDQTVNMKIEGAYVKIQQDAKEQETLIKV
jgi:hypothetical protein